jgi:hypothetical protein
LATKDEERNPDYLKLKVPQDDHKVVKANATAEQKAEAGQSQALTALHRAALRTGRKFGDKGLAKWAADKLIKPVTGLPTAHPGVAKPLTPAK